MMTPVMSSPRWAVTVTGWPIRSDEAGSEIARELYLSLTLNRERGRIAAVASAAGGMDIEQVAHDTPEQILSVAVHPAAGLQPWQCRQLAYGIGLKGDGVTQLQAIMLALYRLYLDKDASLIEINPLVATKQGGLICLDAKMSFDDNAVFRHPDIAAMRDFDEEEPAEVEASRLGLSYVKLDGEIGCMVNGAGLAMATMDIIKLFGAEPANFLDVGGGASKEKVTAAFKIITADPKVKGILINIFGGIMRCDRIAEGVVSASREVGLPVPVVVRLEGTNVALGKEILAKSGLPLITADGMWDAAQKVVDAAKAARPS